MPQQELRLRRQAIIRMAHHSTEIEGNGLDLKQVEALYAKKKIDAPDRDIYEVKNYLHALKYIEKIVAAIAHMEIAAIHPFNDGNGRAARALATLLLYQRGYDFRRLFALEDYYNTNRPAYYKAINLGKTYDERRTDITSWLEYFVTGCKEEIDEVKKKILPLASRTALGKIKSQIYLTPEQLKIIDFLDQMGRIVVKDVEEILSCPRRTAQLQLQKLKKIKLIKATGQGKSTAYIANK